MGAVLKTILGLFVAAAFVAGAVGLFMGDRIAQVVRPSDVPTGPEVRLVPVDEGRIVRTVSAPGDIEPRRKVQISARTSATILALPFEDGDDVKAGDVVVRLDDADLLAALEGAQARLRGEKARFEGARAEYVNATAEWERQRQLYDSNDIAKADLDQAEARMRSAEANLNAAEHAVAGAEAEVARARESLKYTTIVSPIDGRVTTLNAEEGELVVTGTMNNPGTVIMEIADLSEMLVRAEVDETDIALVREGQAANVYVNAYPDEAFEGEVRRIALQSRVGSGQTKVYDAEVVVFSEDDRELYSGLSATVDIEVETLEGVMLVPSQAVLDRRVDELPSELLDSPHLDRDKTFAPVVYAYEDGEAVARPVEVGFSDLRRTAILGGLEAGQRVIVGPWSQLQTLEHEMDVRPERDPISAGEEQPGDEGGEAQPEPDSETAAETATEPETAT